MAKAAATKKVEVEVPQTFTPHLAAFLRQYPAIKRVWVNAEGDYYLVPKAGYMLYSVEDILSKVPQEVASPAAPTDPAQGEAKAEGTENKNSDPAQGEAK